MIRSIDGVCKVIVSFLILLFLSLLRYGIWKEYGRTSTRLDSTLRARDDEQNAQCHERPREGKLVEQSIAYC